jgi:hypothetical protein
MTKDRKLPPPPLGIILKYAADGFSVWNGRFLPSGRPWTPPPIDYAGMLRQLIESREGRRTLRLLTEAGMRGWGCLEYYRDALDGAFSHVSFRALAIAALEDLARTAPKPFTLPEPPPRPPANDIRPGPEPSKPGAGGPTRPRLRPRGPHFSPR